MKQKSSLAVKIALIASLLAILLMVVTPILFFNYRSDYSVGLHAMMGWTGIFGGQMTILQSNDSTFRNFTCNFNWQMYITFIILIVTIFTAYFIGPKGRGYYIFAAILFIGCSVMFFTAKIWLTSTISGIESYETNSAMHLGVGPWAAGFLSLIAAGACIVEFVMRNNEAKARRPVAKK